MSAQDEDVKTLCCLCCASGPITARITCNRQGFVPKEFIECQAEIENKSNRRVTVNVGLRKVRQSNVTHCKS